MSKEQNKIIKESEIEWTSGSGISYGESVYQWWSELLEAHPTERNYRRVRYQIDWLKNKIENLESEHIKILNDPFSGEEDAIRRLELIELYEDALKSLSKLLNDQELSTEESNNGTTYTPNEAAKKMMAVAKSNKPDRDKVISDAVKVIKDSKKPFQEFVTKSNKASSLLYSPVHTKNPGIKKSNIRYWLNKAIEKGTLKKLIAG